MNQHKRPICWVNRNKNTGRRRNSPPTITPPSKPGFLSCLLKKCRKGDEIVISRDEFRPIINYKEHIRILEMHGHPQECIDDIRQKHEDYYDSRCKVSIPVPKIPGRKPSYTDEIVISSLTDKDGKTYTVERVPFRNFNKTKNPHDTVEMYREYGWTEEQIEDLRNTITDWENSIEVRNKHFESVMGKYSGKSTAKKKKKAIRTRFAAKKNNFIKKEEIDFGSSDGESGADE